MIQRTYWKKLSLRTASATRFPLLLLGARGTGKQTLARQFSTLFSDLIWIDLETGPDSNVFTSGENFDNTLKSIFFLKNKDLRHKRTLIFLHEIQNCPEAMRWFADSGQAGLPYHILASSSLITPTFTSLMNDPGKKMDILQVYPFTFEEFLQSVNDQPALEAYQEVPVPVYAYEKLLHYFHIYTLIGGMPEINAIYAQDQHLNSLRPTYERLLKSMVSDINRQNRGKKQCTVVEETLLNTFPFAATRIKFNRFGNSEYRTREMREAFRRLEQQMLIHLIYPTTSTCYAPGDAAPRNGDPVLQPWKKNQPENDLEGIPVSALQRLLIDRAKSPRLQLLDTGLVNYFSGIQKPLFQSHDMNAIFEGQIARQVVGQEILAAESPGGWDGMAGVAPDALGRAAYRQSDLHFWVRDKAQSTAEVDFIIPFNDLLIPVVVKSGEPGRLRSLHQFVDAAPHAFAVRLYAGKLGVQQAQTLKGKKFYLLNLPYFLAGKIKDHLKGFIRLTNG